MAQDQRSRRVHRFRHIALLFAIILGLVAMANAQQEQPIANIYGDPAPNANPGGNITVGIVYGPPGLDPIHQQADATLSVDVLMYQGLVYTDWNGAFKPLLATSWDESPDGLTWTFHIRHDVKFQTGQPLTSADVKYSYDYIRSKDCGCAGSVYLNAVDHIDAPDPYTVVFHLKSPNSAILAGVANKLTAVFPKGYFDSADAQSKLNKTSVGTGPFMLKSFTPNQSITLVKNPNYWQPGVPYLDKITFVNVPDETSLLNGLRNGRIDLALLARPQDVQQLSSNESLHIQKQVPWVWKSIDLQCGSGVTANVKVRQAIALAINKQEVMQAAVQGYGEVIGEIPAGMQKLWGVPLDELPNQKPNLEKARQLLKEAGYPNGLTVNLTTIIGYDWMTPAAATIAAELQKIGIKVNVQRQDLGVWIKNWGAHTFKDLTLNDWGTVPDPSLLYDAHFQKQPIGNDFRNWNSDEGTKLLTEAKQATGHDARYKYYAQFQKLLAQDAPTIPLFSSYLVAVSQPKVHNYNQHPSGWYFGLIKTWVNH